jgi:hypothetical protein
MSKPQKRAAAAVGAVTDDFVDRWATEVFLQILADLPLRAKLLESSLDIDLFVELGPEFNANTDYGKSKTHEKRDKFGEVSLSSTPNRTVS